MAFNLTNFNEVSGVAQAARKALVDSDTESPFPNSIDKKTQRRNKRYFGHSAEEFRQLYESLYGLGQILSSNYFVKFEAYRGNKTRLLPLLQDTLTPYLCTETNLPVIQAEFEMIKVGTMQINSLTGISEPDLQLTMLETADGRIINSLLKLRDLMVNPDGTVNPPASYAMRVTVGLFSKDFGLDVKPVERQWLVAPSLASLDSLNANGVSELAQVPITLSVLRNFME